jgi:hypothetical protein
MWSKSASWPNTPRDEVVLAAQGEAEGGFVQPVAAEGGVSVAEGLRLGAFLPAPCFNIFLIATLTESFEGLSQLREAARLDPPVTAEESSLAVFDSGDPLPAVASEVSRWVRVSDASNSSNCSRHLAPFPG